MKNEKDLEREALVTKKRTESIKLSFKSINKKLKQIHKLLFDYLKSYKAITEFIPKKRRRKYDIIFSKKRNKLENTPNRLWFKMHGIYYYIDFTIRCSKNDKKTNLEGCFIYGTSYYIEKDKVEDKPIVSFIIDEHKIITANNDFEDESWTFKKEHIIDLHLRALDKIWEEALYIINKDKF